MLIENFNNNKHHVQSIAPRSASQSILLAPSPIQAGESASANKRPPEDISWKEMYGLYQSIVIVNLLQANNQGKVGLSLHKE